MDYSIYEYLRHYKDYTFEEEAFNEVDNVILSLIAYAKMGFIFENTKKITVAEASKLVSEKYTKKQIDKNMTAIRKGTYLLIDLGNYKRYKSLVMKNYVEIINDETQFGALMIKLPGGVHYVAFKGTDQNVIGWKEDCEMSYMFPVPAQKLAVKYLNEKVKMHYRKLIVGGHSKGGNLALVSSMYSKPSIKKRIIKVYSNDGPGLRKTEFESEEYKEIKSRFKHIIPRNSLVGMLLLHDENDVVVSSSARGLYQHDATTWKCYGSHFLRDDLTKASRKREVSIEAWLKNYDDETRKKIVESTFSIFEICNITDLTDLKNAKIDQVLRKIMSLKNIDEETRKLVFKTVKELLTEYMASGKKKVNK